MRPHRLEKIASTVRWVVSDAIANKLNDPRVARFTSVTRVEVAGDLSVAKVFISVMGTASEERRTFQALQHATGHVQRLLARALETRQCPAVRFVNDSSLKRAAETARLLTQVVPPEPEAFDEAMEEDDDGRTFVEDGAEGPADALLDQAAPADSAGPREVDGIAGP